MDFCAKNTDAWKKAIRKNYGGARSKNGEDPKISKRRLAIGKGLIWKTDFRPIIST